ncbi:predicted protein [Pyrenophora tritici-repentis Pt-1C-BFP]|uniref:Uncharacterized protein n=1 Tax=Pyrenophora tritici-repentis (strain Pt-1C-BFP) TaxID=426418 RepID=B2WIE0_PYRTR|nr:uncharacterized protein PTRG_09749 [Pyrenophora tritici-repentis Pt-1C-BFP]EDU42800.1 predicted protein [Pyrenophora tritici-repentis Pt-1C-BFP]
MLETILRCASPKTQFVARNINTKWRQTIDYILGSSYRSPEPCASVQYGDAIDAQVFAVPAPDEEVKDAEQQASRLSQMLPPEASQVSYTALITQAHSLSQSAYDAYQAVYERVWRAPAFSFSSGVRRWVDWSQFVFYPYLLQLLLGRMELEFGRCDIALKGGPGPPTAYRSPLVGANFHQLLGPMFLTQPPCKALGTYIPTVGRSSIAPVRVANKQKHYSWCYYGYPKFIIFLEKVDDEVPDALTKTYHHYGEDFANIHGRSNKKDRLV